MRSLQHLWCCFCLLGASSAFRPSRFVERRSSPTASGPLPPRIHDDGRAAAAARPATRLRDMKRPLLDRLATFVFDLENDRVAASSVTDDKGRSGEPMEWADEDSLANRLSNVVQSNGLGYRFKQAVADLVAGEYDREARDEAIRAFVGGTPVALYSFTTCPFCRKAKDFLEDRSIPYEAIELDALEGNEGNEIRAELGRMTGRTSVPSIFIGGERKTSDVVHRPPFPRKLSLVFDKCLSLTVEISTPSFHVVSQKGEYIGGCNDGPGLLPLARENNGEKLNAMLDKAGLSIQ